MAAFTAFACGLVFGLGLLVSGMANPAKVLGFLDLAGRWDPSLMLVMAGAIGVGSVGFAIAGRRRATLLGTPMMLPRCAGITAASSAAASCSAIGWGLAGVCPGPAPAVLGAGQAKAFVFAAAMAAGNALLQVIERLRGTPAARGEGTLAEAPR